MILILISTILFAVLYSPFKKIQPMWAEGRLPTWFKYVGGLLAWLCVFSVFGPIFAIAKLGAELLLSPGPAIRLQLGALILGLIALVKFLDSNPEILNFDQVKPFLLQSLRFETYEIKRDDLFAELEKHNVRKIHKETTGRDLLETEAKKKEIQHTDPEEALREIARLKSKPLRSLHLRTELTQLKQKETVEITDTFKLNAAKRKTHNLYDVISEMKISPSEMLFSFRIVFPYVNAQTKFDFNKLYRLKQELYDVLQALRTEAWLKPYSQFFSAFKVVCYRTDTDTLGLPTEIPFCTVQIAALELAKREGKLLVATELDKIAKITLSL